MTPDQFCLLHIQEQKTLLAWDFNPLRKTDSDRAVFAVKVISPVGRSNARWSNKCVAQITSEGINWFGWWCERVWRGFPLWKFEATPSGFVWFKTIYHSIFGLRGHRFHYLQRIIPLVHICTFLVSFCLCFFHMGKWPREVA